VHKGLHSRGVNAFLDAEDIEEGLTESEWQRQIDKAIIESQVFVLIITNGTSISDPIKHEIIIAREDPNKKILAFIDHRIWDERGETTIILDQEHIINIKDYQVRQFNSRAPESLLREVCDSAGVIQVI
jgi:hypothetical protein